MAFSLIYEKKSEFMYVYTGGQTENMERNPHVFEKERSTKMQIL